MSELKAQIEKRFKELRYDCGLQRLHCRNAFGRRWSGCQRENPDKPSQWDLHWENLQSAAQVQRPLDVAAADKRLADFISESRLIIGAEWPGNDHGRLCWSPFCGGMPIDQHYCQLEEGHDGPHEGPGDYAPSFAWPNSKLQEVTNEHEWYKLIALCPHETPVWKGEYHQCAVCGSKIEPKSVSAAA